MSLSRNSQNPKLQRRPVGRVRARRWRSSGRSAPAAGVRRLEPVARPTMCNSVSVCHARTRPTATTPSRPTNRHPPDMPDERRSRGSTAKNACQKADGAVLRHHDGLVGRGRCGGLSTRLSSCSRRHRVPLTLGQYREVPRRRRRGGGPFERPSIPGIAREVAAALAGADADDELHDGKNDTGEHDQRAAQRHDHQRLPRGSA